MALTATRFYGPTSLTAASVVLVTAPAGHRYLLRTIAICNKSLTVATEVSVTINGSGGSFRAVYGVIAGGADRQLDPWIVLMPGDTLSALAITGTATILICGYDLLE